MHKVTRLLKYLILITLIAGASGGAAQSAAAQSKASRLDSLAVELWPNYDRPAMLVLLTGALPQSAPLPATLTIPIPSGAEIHAVASFNATGTLMSDVDYTVDGGRLTLTTPASRFRVEYYAPYQTDGDQNSYRFDWQADLAVDAMSVVAQQPIAATDFTVDPPANSSTADRGDGLNYYSLPARPVGAGEPFVVTVSYTSAGTTLSAPSPQFALGDESEPATKAATTPSSVNNLWWVLAPIGALFLIIGAWYAGQRKGQASSRARKPQPARPAAKPKPAKKPAVASRYCHQCGQPAQPGDTFCRNCGTQLKGE